MSRRSAASDALVKLTETLMGRGFETSGGMLGGECGYGVYFENGTFMMHPFCWCERPDCPWCRACFCGPDAYRYFLEGVGEVTESTFLAAPDDQQVWPLTDVPENQCGNCRDFSELAPNFFYKPTGVRVTWYKYIGRDMRVTGPADWRAIVDSCVASLDDDPGSGNPSWSSSRQVAKGQR